jgi:hypothetical protein
MHGHVTLCYIVVVGNLNSPLNLFISFANALMEQGFRSDLLLAKDKNGIFADNRASISCFRSVLPGLVPYERSVAQFRSHASIRSLHPAHMSHTKGL